MFSTSPGDSRKLARLSQNLYTKLSSQLFEVGATLIFLSSVTITTFSHYRSTCWTKTLQHCFSMTTRLRLSASVWQISRSHRFHPSHLLEGVPLGRLPSMGLHSCYLGCLLIVLKENYVTGRSPFSGFNDVNDVMMNLCFAPYPLVYSITLQGHSNHCPFHISFSSS